MTNGIRKNILLPSTRITAYRSDKQVISKSLVKPHSLSPLLSYLRIYLHQSKDFIDERARGRVCVDTITEYSVLTARGLKAN